LRVAAAAPKPLILGSDLINLGLKPSPKFGEILSKCFDAQLEGVFSDYESGKVYLENLIRNNCGLLK
jgi:tRNA nucleotidyltransferase (CCA-adding enzyme)